MNTQRFTRSMLPWHRTRIWHRFLQDLLLVRGRHRYTLSISPHHPLGATDPHHRRVLINPFDLPDPGEPARWSIRWAPSLYPDAWQQALATALVEHEAGHIRHSGNKPAAPLLGWLWNALEDERQERRQIADHPLLAQTFDFLGDAVWCTQHPTSDLLAGCLLWRWEWDRAISERKFHPLDEERVWWEEAIRPLVEAAWHAPTSDAVTDLARRILDTMGLPHDAPVPDDLPRQLCRCGQGHGTQPGRELPTVPEVPIAPHGVSLPGHPRASSPEPIAEGDPAPLLAEVEGYARSLAASLRPPQPQQHTVPHLSRGAFVLERAMVRTPRPFDHCQAPAPSKEVALLLLIDESGSMGDNWDSGSLIAGAMRATMLVARAAELADITCGVWAFTDEAEPNVLRRLSRGVQPPTYARIAGMDGWGDGTWLSDVFQRAVDALDRRSEPLKLLIVIHDGALIDDDAERVQQIVATLRKHRIMLQPLLLGDDPRALEANMRVFGHVLACPDIDDLAHRLSAWLRAIVGS